MKLGVYCVYDRVARVFSNIHTEVNDPVAVRSFRVAYSSVFGKEEAFDFDLNLYRIGWFDTETGKLEYCERELLADCLSISGRSNTPLASPDEFGGIYL